MQLEGNSCSRQVPIAPNKLATLHKASLQVLICELHLSRACILCYKLCTRTRCVSGYDFELSTAKQQCATDFVSQNSIYGHMHVLHWPCPGMTVDIKLLHVQLRMRKCVDTIMVDAKFHHPQHILHGLHCCQVLDFRHRGVRSICPHIKRHAVQLTRFSLVPCNSYHRYNVHVQHPKWSTSCFHISSRHSTFYQNPRASHAVITPSCH